VQQEGSHRDSLQTGRHLARMSSVHGFVRQPIENRDYGVATLMNSAHNLGTRQVAITELSVAISDVSRRAQSRANEVHQRARRV
jgi:hypothetical protein